MEGKKASSSKSKAKKPVEYEKEEDNQHKEFVDKVKKRAQVRAHGIDNHATFEHPASFQALTGRPEKASIRDFIE